MYVCVCNAYRDTEIRAVAQTGVRCAREAYLELGNGPRCGRCLSFAQVLIDRIHDGQAPAAYRVEASGEGASQ